MIKASSNFLFYRLRNIYFLLRFPLLHSIFRKFSTFTMIPRLTYVKNLALVKEYRNVQGAVVECGTWRGGMIGGIASVLGGGREYFLYDSFEGLPDAKMVDGALAINWQNDKQSPLYFDNCRAEVSEAEKAMKLSGVTKFHIVKGWFDETLPSFPEQTKIAILRLDGDWYESTMICLENLYPKVVSGGIIIIDDYHVWDGCSRAIHDYLARETLNDRICQWHDDVAYILKRGESLHHEDMGN